MAIAGALVVGIGACGAAKGLAGGVMSMSVAAANTQINSDLKRAPYMACVFDTAPGVLLRVIELSLPKAGYQVASVAAGEVRTKPSESKQTGSVYKLEMLTGFVSQRGDSSLVWLRYQVGESEQATTFFSTSGAQPTTSYDRRHYGDLMKNIAAAVNRPDCEHRTPTD